MRARLAFVAPAAYPLGGLATWLDYLVPGLCGAGFSVETLLTSGRWHDVEAYSRAHPTLSVTPVHCATGSREGRVRALTNALRATAADLVVVVNVPDAYAALARLRKAAGVGPRCAMTIHAIEPEFFDDLRANADVIDGTIGTNRLVCELARDSGGCAPDRVLYAPYGVELPEKLRPHEDRGVLEILFAGRLEEDQKRVGLLPRLIERLDRVGLRFRLTVAGDGPDGAALERALASHRERGTVEWLGRVDRERLVRDVLPAHDLFLLTSAWETGPIAIWEAMAIGLAVVSSRYLGSGLEGALVDRENCRLFDVGALEDAASAIVDLADPRERSVLAREGRRLVERRYSTEISIATWVEAFRRVLGLEGPPLRYERRPRSSGRLDRALGVRVAESVRNFVGRRFLHGGPGGEWPHSYGSRSRLSEFVERARVLDRWRA